MRLVRLLGILLLSVVAFAVSVKEGPRRGADLAAISDQTAFLQ
jgi:hypothetical protein